jgi:hypothetical protein
MKPQTQLAVLAVTVFTDVAAARLKPASAPNTIDVAVVRLETNATAEALGIDTQIPRFT